MKMFVEPDDIYLHTGFVDFRKSINGLLTIIENEWEVDAFTGALFIFCNKKQDKLKLLYGIRPASPFDINALKNIIQMA